MQRDFFTCVLCEDKDSTLNIHHEIYEGEPWDAPNERLKTVCEHCHRMLEETAVPKFNLDIVTASKVYMNMGHFVVIFAHVGDIVWVNAWDCGKYKWGLSINAGTAQSIDRLLLVFALAAKKINGKKVL